MALVTLGGFTEASALPYTGDEPLVWLPLLGETLLPWLPLV